MASRPIGSKATLKGKPVQWAGPDYGWQSPESFKKLEDEEYFAPGEGFSRGALRVLQPVSNTLGNIFNTAYRTANEISPQSALGKGMMIGASQAASVVPEALTKGADKIPGVGPSSALLVGGVANELLERAIPPLNLIPDSIKKAYKLSSGEQRLLKHLTPKALKEITDPGLKMLYEKAAKILNTPGLSKRNAEVLLQTGPDSGLIKLLKGVDDPEVIDKVINSYFTRNQQYFSGGFNFNLDHLVPVSSTAKLASKVKPAVFQEALAMQLKKFGRRFGHDQEFSLIPRRTHAAKHTGSTQAILEGASPDWKTKYLDGIIDDLPENASVEQVSEALSQMYDKSLQETGKALSDPDFFSIREGVMDSLPSRVRTILGENFDITGRMSSVEDPLKWKLFLAHLRQAPAEVKSIMQEISQVKQVDLSKIKKFQ